MPKNREQIKHDPVSREVWRNNHTQVGGLWFDPLKIRPLGDHIVVQLDGESPYIELDGKAVGLALEKPDVAMHREIGTRIGTVVSVGPGKWIEKPKHAETWILGRWVRKPMTLKPGDRVVIGHFSDWESWSCDYEARGRNVVLCQEADVRLYQPQ